MVVICGSTVESITGASLTGTIRSTSVRVSLLKGSVWEVESALRVSPGDIPSLPSQSTKVNEALPW